MASGITGKHLQLNPELEALRDKGLVEGNSGDLHDMIARLVQKTTRIHAAYLFDAPLILQRLCLSISETPNKISDEGWEKFGHHLNLSVSILKVINHNNFTKEDPTYNTLLAYAQQDDATVGKIIEALKVMGRLDVISKINEDVNEFADKVLHHHSNLNDISAEEGSSDYGSIDSTEGDIILPLMKPPAPFIFRKFEDSINLTSAQFQFNNITSQSDMRTEIYESSDNEGQVQALPPLNLLKDIRTHELMVNAESRNGWKPLNITQDSEAKKKIYGKKILLTFASDGEKIACEISRSFRRLREGLPNIGVVVLEEHSELVNKDPQQFINAAFYQVDYVCPILTEGYLKTIARKEKKTVSTTMHLDAIYVQYIFSLMNSYYVTNGCINDKVRCIIPDHLVSAIHKNLLMSGPVFSSWVKSSEVDELANRLLKSPT